MTCTEIREQLVECWGDEGGLCVEAQAHLRECKECRQEAALLRGTRGLLTTVRVERAPEGFTQRVMANISQTPQEATAWHERAAEWLWPRHSGAPAWGRAAAVAAIFIVLLGGLFMVNSGQGPVATTAPSVVASTGGPSVGTPVASEELEALVLRHQQLELSQTLSDDAGVTLISYTY